MRRLGPYDAQTVPSFAALVADSTPVRKAALQPLEGVVAAACTDYDTAIPDVHNLQAIPVSKGQRDALIDGYNGRTLAIKRRLAKMIASLPAADADLCPYCSLDTNPDLDHFLPKTIFPEFSLHARNLVPICTRCNRKKLNAFKTNVGGHRLFLHPSAEPPNNAQVLEADLTFRSNGVTVSYRIDDKGVLSTSARQMVERHFSRLGLGARYRRRAHSYLASFKASTAGKPRNIITRTLHQKINTAPVGEPINGWRPALYRAIVGNVAETLNWLLQP